MQTKLIREHQPGWLDTLQEEIASLHGAHQNVNVLALIDCAFNERCHTAIRKHHLPSRSLFDLSDNPSPELQAVSPTLVPLTPSTAPAWREVLRRTDGWPMLSLLVTPESLDEVALRLSPWCIVSADGQPFVFRFPDTRRLPDIVDVLTRDQHAALFGPALAWRYRTRSARWAELPLPKEPAPIAESVKLDAKQCAQLIRASEADEIIASLDNLDPALLHAHHPAAAHELVAKALQRADAYGIEAGDRKHWCTLFMQQPRLEQLPAAASLFTAMRLKERNYADIRTDLNRLAQA